MIDMKSLIFLIGILFCTCASIAQKTIPLEPVPLVYYPKSITVQPTGSINGTTGTFQIYYELRDTNDKRFEIGNKDIPAQFFPLFLESANPEGLQFLLQAEGLQMKLEDEANEE